MTLQLVISWLVTVVLAFFLFALLLNQLAPQYLTELMKNALQSEREKAAAARTEDLEYAKSELQTVLERYKVGISTLHRARADVSADLYAKLLESWWAWDIAVRALQPENPIDDTYFGSSLKSSDDFRTLSYRSRLYLTTAAVTLVFQAQAKFENMKTVVQARHIDSGTAFDSIVAAYDNADSELTELIDQLEQEFRRILGAEDKLAEQSAAE